MKKFWLIFIVAGSAGTAAAWMANNSKYGNEAEFGPLTLDGRVNSDNVMQEIAKNYSEQRSIAEVVGGQNHDFGVMGPGEQGEHTFVVKNKGDAPLSLKLGATTCKCTFLDDMKPGEERFVAPGEEREITLKWTVKTDEIFFSQSAQVITNDPGNVALNLMIQGRVVREIEVVPDAWTFGEVAAGEEFEFGGAVYSYLDETVVPDLEQMAFTNDQLTELAEFEVKPFTPTEADAPHSRAKQAFRVTAKIKPGMRQGALSTSLAFSFSKADDEGEIIDPDKGAYYVHIDAAGRIVGSLTMLLGSKLKESGGSYIYDFGRLKEDDSLKAKTFIVLKGAEREKTKLSIGEIFPGEALQAKMGDPVTRGTMVLYPLELEVVPGDENLDYLGKNKTDFGWVWIESDNPKVARMRLAVRFAVDAKP